MNHSIYSADRMTHLKIVVVALVAAILVAGFSISARTTVMNSDSFEGCIARLRSSPAPTSDSAKACSHFADSAISGK